MIYKYLLNDGSLSNSFSLIIDVTFIEWLEFQITTVIGQAVRWQDYYVSTSVMQHIWQTLIK